MSPRQCPEHNFVFLGSGAELLVRALSALSALSAVSVFSIEYQHVK